MTTPAPGATARRASSTRLLEGDRDARHVDPRVRRPARAGRRAAALPAGRGPRPSSSPTCAAADAGRRDRARRARPPATPSTVRLTVAHAAVRRASAGSRSPSAASPSSAPPRSMAVAAQSALPGDALYPVKRAIENAETGFQVSDDAKGQHLLAHAAGRLDEVDELASQGDGADAAAVAADPRRLRRPGHRGLRPAARRLRRTPATEDVDQRRCATSPPTAIDDLNASSDVDPRRGRAPRCSTPPRSSTQIDSAAANALPDCARAAASPSSRSPLLASGGTDARRRHAARAPRPADRAVEDDASRPGRASRGKGDKDADTTDGDPSADHVDRDRPPASTRPTVAATDNGRARGTTPAPRRPVNDVGTASAPAAAQAGTRRRARSVDRRSSTRTGASTSVDRRSSAASAGGRPSSSHAASAVSGRRTGAASAGE